MYLFVHQGWNSIEMPISGFIRNHLDNSFFLIRFMKKINQDGLLFSSIQFLLKFNYRTIFFFRRISVQWWWCFYQSSLFIFFFVVSKNDEIQCTTFSYQRKYSQWAKLKVNRFIFNFNFNFNFHCLIFNELNKSCWRTPKQIIEFFSSSLHCITCSCWMVIPMFSDSKFDLPSPLDSDILMWHFHMVDCCNQHELIPWPLAHSNQIMIFFYESEIEYWRFFVHIYMQMWIIIYAAQRRKFRFCFRAIHFNIHAT